MQKLTDREVRKYIIIYYSAFKVEVQYRIGVNAIECYRRAGALLCFKFYPFTSNYNFFFILHCYIAILERNARSGEAERANTTSSLEKENIFFDIT